jgi:hypothetical protein
MFFFWLVDESAAGCTPEKEPGSPSARNDVPLCSAAAADALFLFSKHSRVRSPSIRRLGHFKSV